MATATLTKKQLQSIEREIDEINAKAALLNPADPSESEQLFLYDLELDRHLEKLESFYRKARINEIGLFVVR